MNSPLQLNHARFTQQAGWTKDLRDYLYESAGINNATRIIEIGCGTGAVLSTLRLHPHHKIFGFDINPDYIRFVSNQNPDMLFSLGDANKIPYPDNCFDIAYCHFLLLWIKNPINAVEEMVRITRPGGSVIAFAEPDYDGRIDYPPQFQKLGELQKNSLSSQGANPQLGRQLASLFSNAKLTEIQVGVINGSWKYPISEAEFEIEWQIINSDLNATLSTKELELYKNADAESWKKGERILYVPTFYAIGKVTL